MTRRAARTDTTHAAIREALREVGCIVQDTHALGDGFPDLLVIEPNTGRVATLTLCEVKDMDGRFTPNAVKFILRLVDPCYRVLLSPEQAIGIFRNVEQAVQIAREV